LTGRRTSTAAAGDPGALRNVPPAVTIPEAALWVRAATIAAQCLLLVATAGAALAQDAAAGKAKAEQACAACHGADGDSPNSTWPNLARQTARYIYLQLRDFKEGRRSDPVMTPFAQTLTREEMLDLAAYFSSQRPKPSNYKVDPERAALGKAKAEETLCTMCHLGGFSGQNEIPRVAGQQFDYIVKQMQDFKVYRRTNDAGTMTAVAKTLSDEDIVNLAHYITSLD
jgi:cytochrome c553